MIGVERKGRLGKQIFGCAFALRASRELATSSYMADDELHDVFALDGARHVDDELGAIVTRCLSRLLAG
jgi:hypothetical protein